MRTTISINDSLLRKARAVAGTTSPSRIVEAGLEALVRERRRSELVDWIRSGDFGLSMGRLRGMRGKGSVRAD